MAIWVTILSLIVFSMVIGGFSVIYMLIDKTNRHETLIAEIRGRRNEGEKKRR